MKLKSNRKWIAHCGCGIHFHTEQPVLAHLQKYLQKCAQEDKWLVDIDIFQNSDVFKYY